MKCKIIRIRPREREREKKQKWAIKDKQYKIPNIVIFIYFPFHFDLRHKFVGEYVGLFVAFDVGRKWDC